MRAVDHSPIPAEEIMRGVYLRSLSGAEANNLMTLLTGFNTGSDVEKSLLLSSPTRTHQLVSELITLVTRNTSMN